MRIAVNWAWGGVIERSCGYAQVEGNDGPQIEIEPMFDHKLYTRVLLGKGIGDLMHDLTSEPAHSINLLQG